MKSTLTIALFSLGIAIGVAALSVFQFEKYQKFTQDMHANFSKLENEIQTKANAQSHRFDKMVQQEQTLLSKVQTVNWVLAEAEYLVRLAEVRLRIARDVKTAIVLLQTAEDKIQTLNDPRFDLLRAALLKDKVALQNTVVPNPEELWARIDTIITQVKQLPTRGFQVPENNTAETAKTESMNSTSPQATPNTSNQPAWQRSLVDSLHALKDLVKIRYHSKPLKPVLDETEQTLVKENLRLLLEEIRFSILNSQPTLYTAAIRNTQDWLKEYFEGTNETVKNIQTSLSVLAETNLHPELPSLTHSLEAFNALRQ